MTFLMLGLATAAHQLGWIDGLLLGRVAAAVAFVFGLITVVRLPWDLTFQARNALAQMEALRTRGLVVDETEISFARKSATRALVLALALHLVGAGLAFAARSILGAELGMVIAVAFLGSMALRPIHAFYLHTRQRLMRAQRDAAVPAPDAHTLAHADAELRAELEMMSQALETHREVTQGQLALIEERTVAEANAWRNTSASTDEKLERVLREFERTIDRTQQNGEVLAGIRAFVQLIREA
jgi:hypothetical protein